MRIGSLFSGAGGFDVAAERAGMTVAWQSETDKYANQVLEHHWPGKNKGDIHGIRETEGVELLVGGFPCQSYSIAGGRGGLAEDRGALWWEFHRLIREGQPAWVVGENVPGLLSSAGGRDFATIIRSLVQLGYGVVWRVLDAQWFGVPQRRKRVFIVGHLGGRPKPGVLALGESLSGDPAPSRETGTEVAGALASRTTAGGGLGPDFEMDGGLQPLLAETGVVRALTQRFGEAGSDLTDAEGGHLVVNTRQDPIVSTVAQPLDDGSRFGQAVLPVVMRQREGKPGGGKGPLLSVDRSLTLAAETNDQTLFDLPAVRRLTPLECVRLMGFPDDWFDGIGLSNKQMYRRMGNAVVVPVAQWIMEQIAREDQP